MSALVIFNPVFFKTRRESCLILREISRATFSLWAIHVLLVRSWQICSGFKMVLFTIDVFFLNLSHNSQKYCLQLLFCHPWSFSVQPRLQSEPQVQKILLLHYSVIHCLYCGLVYTHFPGLLSSLCGISLKDLIWFLFSAHNVDVISFSFLREWLVQRRGGTRRSLSLLNRRHSDPLLLCTWSFSVSIITCSRKSLGRMIMYVSFCWWPIAPICGSVVVRFYFCSVCGFLVCTAIFVGNRTIFLWIFSSFSTGVVYYFS